jgi:hypothetical protein
MRVILFAPVFAVGLPALVLLVIIILIVEDSKGALRSLCAAEIRKHGILAGIRRFMEQVFVPNYKNHIQSFVLGGAGILVVAVGLRGLGAIPVELMYVALAVEFTLLTVWAIMIYYTAEEAEEEIRGPIPVGHHAGTNRELVEAVKELSTHIAFLERRLAVTEAKFEHLGHLDSSMQALSSRLNLLVSDQLGLRVKQEFDKILADLVQRTAEHKVGDEPKSGGDEHRKP